MKNKLYIISAAILSLSVMLAACSDKSGTEQTNKTNETATTVVETAAEQTEPVSETVTYVDESGYHVISVVIPSETQLITHPPVPTHKNELAYKTEDITKPHSSATAPVTQSQTKPTQQQITANRTEKATAQATVPVTVPEKSNGLTLLFKIDDVSKGNDAAVTVIGEKGKEYTIEVYRNGQDKLTSNSLKPVIADSNGLASWTFSTQNCDKGYRKIIIREIGSDKYIQTSIYVK